jgi:hypothetical protein
MSHFADIPSTNVLVKVKRKIEHGTVRRHAAHGGREGGHSVRSWYTYVASTSCAPSSHGTRQWCGVAVASGSFADGNSGMAGRCGRGAGVIHSGACSGSDSGHLTSEDRHGEDKGATRYGDKCGEGGAVECKLTRGEK